MSKGIGKQSLDTGDVGAAAGEQLDTTLGKRSYKDFDDCAFDLAATPIAEKKKKRARKNKDATVVENAFTAKLGAWYKSSTQLVEGGTAELLRAKESSSRSKQSNAGASAGMDSVIPKKWQGKIKDPDILEVVSEMFTEFTRRLQPLLQAKQTSLSKPANCTISDTNWDMLSRMPLSEIIEYCDVRKEVPRQGLIKLVDRHCPWCEHISPNSYALILYCVFFFLVKLTNFNSFTARRGLTSVKLPPLLTTYQRNFLKSMCTSPMLLHAAT
jgi:hypothetical protein